ncbi:MAG: Do family serine endopeptidase [Burkholderiaceae bacterium]|nr:Do family serine endopeptidase [Burkholderiaceae bacterium]MEB2350069.1 Do family serine endopeptidase [Burkholderiaceae bacterium]
MNRYALIAAAAIAGLAGNDPAWGWSLNPAEWFTRTSAPTASTSPPTTDAVTPGLVAPISAPDYRTIFERFGPAVVGITVEGAVAPVRERAPEFDNDPFFRFYRGLPIPPSPRGDVPLHGQGSGFIVSEDGLILTNAHVVRDANSVSVKLADRREFEAKVLGVDPATDVAVLRITASGLPVVQFGDPSRLAVGDYVLAIGSPFGFEQSATSGIVSAKGRSLPGDTYVPFIQTDVAVNPGNSGGPLFDARGRVVGINSQIYSRTGGYQGLSFAIPIDVAVRVKDQILATGSVRHARLGVTVQELNQGLAESFRLDSPRGALVAGVAPGSAAEKAGLRAGDVVLALNGERIERSGDLAAMVGRSNPGDRVALDVVRQGRRETLTAVLAELPGKTEAAPRPSSERSERRLGVAVRPLAPQERQATRLNTGLVVEDVSGPAQRAGIEPGDVILSVNGKPVATVEQLRGLVNGDARQLALLVQRGDLRIFVPVRLG